MTDTALSLDMRHLRARHSEASEEQQDWPSYESARMSTWKRLGLPTTEFDSVLEQLIRSTRGSTTMRRDRALIYLHMGTGLWPGEIAGLLVRDFIDARGNVVRTSMLRNEIARLGKGRPLLWVNATLVAAIVDYLEERRKLEIGTTNARSYRGLDPDSALIVVNEEGAQVAVKGTHRVARPMYNATNAIFHRSGTGVQPRDGRRLFAQRLYELGAEPNTICDLLGRTRGRFMDWLNHKPNAVIRAQSLLCHAF